MNEIHAIIFRMTGRSNDLLDVMNQALALLGADPDTSYDNPDTAGGVKLKPFLPRAIDEIQRGYFWKELLTQNPLTAVVGEEGRYDIPADCLRPIGIKLDPTVTQENPRYAGLMLKYEIVGQEVRTIATDPELFYIRREDDPTKWSSELDDAVCLAAAVNSGFTITDNAPLVQMRQTQLEQLVLPRARLLQSKYATNLAKYVPRGFSQLNIRMGY